MKRILASTLVLTLGACAALNPPAFVPGQSTPAEVDARMGPAAEVRRLADGDSVRFYTRYPWGTYAARVDASGRLRSFDQVLTEANAQKLRSRASTIEEVRDLLGPPYRADEYPRISRVAWSYRVRVTGIPERDLVVQFTPDGVVREVFLMDARTDGDA